MRKDHVKIILPCTNEGEWLRVTVDSILAETDYPSLEISILANGDEITDFTFAETPSHRNRVKVERVAERLGVGGSINRAVVPGDAAYYAFLDAHCLVRERDWLEQAVACLEKHPKASMVQPEVIQFHYEPALPPGGAPDPAHIEEQSRAYSICWTWPYEHPWDLAEVQTQPASGTPYEAMAGGGMVVFTRAETFHRLGRYDPEVGGWYPETMDYCVRAWMLGHPMIVDPRIRVLHRVKPEGPRYPMNRLDVIHGVLRTAYKYLSPRRRDIAEILFRRHGLGEEVEQALDRIRRGGWLEERSRHLRGRVHDDDWLFARFGVYEERFGIEIP